MTFIGFITEKENEDNFRKALNNILRKIDKKTITIAINEKSIENIKNIHFETVIVNKNLNNIKELLKSTRYLILNEDCVDASQFKDLNLTVITYGFGNKSTITISSIGEDRIMICLQRCIENIKNMQIEPQEISINRNVNHINNYEHMALEAILLLYN